MPNPAKIAELMKGGEVTAGELERSVLGLPLETAFELCHDSLKHLSDGERFPLWHCFRHPDRMAGILCVAELRMPQYHVFGPFGMLPGDGVTDYDRARAFILRKRRPGPAIPTFYPEVMRLPPRERVVALAEAHVRCTPGGLRQANLFSLCGKLDFASAQASTKPQGTTCALFLRAVLRAAGDTRMTDELLPAQANMLSSMGLQNRLARVAEGSRFCWVDMLNEPAKSTRTPRRGDLYYVIIPGVIFPKADEKKQDSGHVGVVLESWKAGNNLYFNSIDGGQGPPGSGFWTERGHEAFEIVGDGHWRQYNKSKVQGQSRVLVGFVDLDRVASGFSGGPAQSLSGRSIALAL